MELQNTGNNTRSLLERLGGNEGIAVKIITKFLSDSTQDELNQCISVRDYKGAYKAAHTLKGVAGNLGFDRIYDLCVDMRFAIEHQNYEETNQLFQKLITEYDDVIRIISKYEKSEC